MEWSKSFQKSVSDTIKKINTIFNDNSCPNEVLAFDFTFFFPEKSIKNLWNILIFQYSADNYVAFLKNLYESSDGKFAKFNHRTKVVIDLCDPPTTSGEIRFQPPQLFTHQELNTTNFVAREWHNDLKQIKPGASIVVSKEFDTETLNLQAGVYLLLKNKFGCFENETYDFVSGSGEYNDIDSLQCDENAVRAVKQLWVLLEKLLYDKMFDLFADKLLKEITLETTKATIHEIASRNIAHHLTSHVSPRATLDKVLERLGHNTDIYKAAYLGKSDNYLQVLHLLNTFNKYRDERSEFLTYATSIASPSSALFFRDIFRPFIENILLIDNIATNENVNYISPNTVATVDSNFKKTSNLRLRIEICQSDSEAYKEVVGLYQNDNERTIIHTSLSIPYLLTNFEKVDWYFKEDLVETDNSVSIKSGASPFSDFEVVLPGTLGKHALYSILENVIRNSAKHGLYKSKDGIDIFLRIKGFENPDNFTITLSDNCSHIIDKVNQPPRKPIKISDFEEKINAKILEKQNLGIIDMKVNACLLEGKELTDDNCKGALKALDYEGILSYEFKISKPKKAVFIGYQQEERNDDGYFFFPDISSFQKSEITKSFQFAVIESDILKTQKRQFLEIKHTLPVRILTIDKKNDGPIGEWKDLDKLYQMWLVKLRGKQASNIHIHFQQNDEDPLTSKYKNIFKDDKELFVYSTDDLEYGILQGTKNILYDRHGAILSEFREVNFALNANSWVLIDKNNTDFDYLAQYNLNSSNKNLLKHELEEAGCLSVLIIDERVAEQSVRSISSDSDANKLSSRDEFKKTGISSPNSLSDLAWASNVYMATQLNGRQLKAEIDVEKDNVLDVGLKDGMMLFQTNFFRDDIGTRHSDLKELPLKIDVVIIHRTKLQDLIEKDKESMERFFEVNPNTELIVTTGSGSTHGIEGNFKILPFTSLESFVLGKRIQKLKFSKAILQLTNNKV